MSEENPVPNEIGPYRILQKIGKGGMGEVYLAEDNRLLRKVALKILPAEFTQEPDRLQRFRTEARAASALNHPNILTVYDIGQIGNLHFIATEYIEGKTLRTILSQKKLTVPEILEIILQTIHALTIAHEAGIVHRDLKPENVMIRSDGYVKILDFGLAKIEQPSSSINLTEAPTITEAGYVMGTVKYMSPEQVRGQPADGRSDIFSIGVTLYEMLAGSPPFQGQTRSDVIAAILEKDPLPLTDDVPGELEWIVTKMLRKDKESRYQTAKELLQDLRQFKQKLEVSTGVKQAATVKSKDFSPIHKYRIRLKFLLGTLAVVLLIVLGLFLFKKETGNINSIAVLPLRNEGRNTEMDYLTDGITETIIRSLSQLPNFRVMSQSTVFRYKGKEVDPKTVGRDLGVQAVMTGKVIPHKDNLLITIEIADARNSSYIWSHQYRVKDSDLLSIESQIAADISERLRLELTSNEKNLIAKRSTENVEAYQLYLKGRYFWNKRTKEGFEKAITYFRQALDTDPNYALAWSGLADCYLGQTFYQFVAPKQTMPKARAAVEKALELDESLPEAHISMAHIAVNYDWDWSSSEREFKRGIQLNPNYPTGHQWYAIHYLTPMGRFDEALAEMKRAQDLDPLSPSMISFTGATFYLAGRYEEAAIQCRKAQELESNFPVAHWHLGLIYEKQENYEEAISEHKKAIDLSGGSPRLIAALGVAFAKSSKRDEAMSILTKLNQISKHSYVSPYELSAIYVALGDKERAFQLLEDAFNERSFHITYLNVRPDFDPIRNDPRFENLIHRIGLNGN